MSLIGISRRNQVGFLELQLLDICFHVLLKISIVFFSLPLSSLDFSRDTEFLEKI